MAQTGLVAAMTVPRQPFVLLEFPVPDPGPGAILVRVQLANICGSDLHLWRGDYKPADPGGAKYRSVGHEMVGVVAKLGPDVSRDSAGQPLREGDRIVYRYFYPCGQCRACLRRQTPRCLQAMRYRYSPEVWPHFNAAYGQYYYLHPNHTVFRVPDNVSDELAAPANCALAQAIYALEQAGATLGDCVVIQGAGGVGLNAVAVAREIGVEQVIVLDAFPERLALAREFGADETICLNDYPTAQARVERVRQLTGGCGADIVLELSGHADAFTEGVAMLGVGGTYVVVGNICAGRSAPFDSSELVLYGRRVLGIMWYEADSLYKALQLLSTRQSRYPFHKVLSHKFPLRDINDAFAQQDAGRVQRAALLPWA